MLFVSGMPTHDQGFFGHPRGLSTLFFTELWERFSYYGMRAILILFMTAAPATGGLGYDTGTAGAVYGLYTSMVYMMSLPGGWVADRLIGQQAAVLWGGILIMCGHFSMALPHIGTFYFGLLLIVLGTGLLKPNVSAIVGQIYAPDDVRRDAGFSIFYMGINIGGFTAPLVCGYLGQRVDWHWGFGAAGIGMAVGLIQYQFGRKYLGDAGRLPAPAASPAAAATLRSRTLAIVGAFVVAVALVAGGGLAGWWTIDPVTVADVAGYVLLALVVVFFGWLYFVAEWTPAERNRLYAIGVFFVAASLFWSLFEQAGSTLNLFAERATDTTLFGIDFPSSYFQSLNSLYIILLAPVFAWLWVWLGPREPSSTVKFALGLIQVGAGFAILIVAATLSAQGIRVSPAWLAVTYLLHTTGELCLSPVGLSVMTKLAPARIVGLMMGVWFLASSVGNYIGGRLAAFYGEVPLSSLFGIVGALGIAFGFALWLLTKPMRRLMGSIN